MTSPSMNYLDDADLDDAALWAAIDSAAASSSSSSAAKPRKHQHLLLKPSPIPSPHVRLPNSPDGEVLQGPCKPAKSARFTSPLSLPKIKAQRTNTNTNTNTNMNMNMNMNTSPVYGSPETRIIAVNDSPVSYVKFDEGDGGSTMRHSLSGRFPTVSLFKEYQNAAMAILEKGDYTMISGHPYIKKTGWRKISCYFNMSYEIRDKTIEFDEDRNVIRAEFIVRAFMQGGRFSDGWGSCERREKRFSKPNHDIPSTAETRAKNKACQDLLGIGEYRPGASHV